MTRDERRRQAAAAIEICERITPRMKAQGDMATLSDDRLAQVFDGVELRAAKWLRFVAQCCGRDNKKKKELA
jgi:hypothetical protein